MLVVRTQSGSVYEFDNNRMTWSRRNDTPGRERIRFHEESNSGRLAAPVEPRVGERLTFYEADHNWIVTTTVVSVSEEFSL